MADSKRFVERLAAATGLIGSVATYLAVPGQPAHREPASFLSSFFAVPQAVVSAADAGPTIPTVGRSTFDLLFSKEQTPGGKRVYDIPFPFEKLIERLQSHIEAPGAGVKGVHIPLGRSLQRNAAAPDHFFRSPRQVIFVDGQPKQDQGDIGFYLKDRFYIGYQEAAAALEVISYNEKAGRFEFQVVHDYQLGGSPKVKYAERQVCFVCHQNQAPIFSDPDWFETNADKHTELVRRIAEANPPLTGPAKDEFDLIPNRVSQDGKNLHGIPMKVSLKVPNSIDLSTDNANELAAYQLLWQKGCETPECRGQALVSALQALLSNRGSYDQTAQAYQAFEQELKTNWRKNWSDGLSLPSPNILARNPLLPEGQDGSASQVTDLLSDPRVKETLKNILRSERVNLKLEASVPRAPLPAWTTPWIDTGTYTINRLVDGVMQFFAYSDAVRLDRKLIELSQGTQPERLESECDTTVDTSEAPTYFVSINCHAPMGAGAQTASAMFGGEFVIQDGKIEDGKSLATVKVKAMGDTCNLGGCPTLQGETEGKFEPGSGDQPAKMLLLPRASSGRELSLRDPKGRRLARIDIVWDKGNPQKAFATTHLYDDFARVEKAVDTMIAATRAQTTDVLGVAPIQRSLILERLYQQLDQAAPSGMGGLLALEGEQFNSLMATMPRTLSDPVIKLPERFQAFERRCQSCHGLASGGPPNFLFGTDEQIADKIKHCAPRIAYRIASWEDATIDGKKIEADSDMAMPPRSAMGNSELRHAWLESESYKAIVKEIEANLPEKWRNKRILLEDYDSLDECLDKSGASNP